MFEVNIWVFVLPQRQGEWGGRIVGRAIRLSIVNPSTPHGQNFKGDLLRHSSVSFFQTTFVFKERWAVFKYPNISQFGFLPKALELLGSSEGLALRLGSSGGFREDDPLLPSEHLRALWNGAGLLHAFVGRAKLSRK